MLLFYNDANLGNRDDRTFFALLSGGFLGEESLHVKPCQLVVTKPSKVDLLDKVRHTIRSMGVVPCQLFLQCLSVLKCTNELIFYNVYILCSACERLCAPFLSRVGHAISLEF